MKHPLPFFCYCLGDGVLFGTIKGVNNQCNMKTGTGSLVLGVNVNESLYTFFVYDFINRFDTVNVKRGQSGTLRSRILRCTWFC